MPSDAPRCPTSNQRMGCPKCGGPQDEDGGCDSRCDSPTSDTQAPTGHTEMLSPPLQWGGETMNTIHVPKPEQGKDNIESSGKVPVIGDVPSWQAGYTAGYAAGLASGQASRAVVTGIPRPTNLPDALRELEIAYQRIHGYEVASGSRDGK